MDYQELLDSLSQQGKAVLENQLVDEDTIIFLDGSDLQAMNLKFGDIARIKKFIQARNNNNKRGRETEGADDSDDESRARLEAKKRNQNASKLVSEGILDDPLKLASLLPKNWVGGSVSALMMVWRGLFVGNHHLWEEGNFLALLVDQLCCLSGPRTAPIFTLVWGRLVVWGAKIKGENDAAASWAQRLVKEKEPLGTDDTKVRLMMEFLGTSTKKSSTNSQNAHHQHLPQQQSPQQQQQASTQVSNSTQQRRAFRYGRYRGR
jgi:hypothetical protein